MLSRSVLDILAAFAGPLSLVIGIALGVRVMRSFILWLRWYDDWRARASCRRGVHDIACATVFMRRDGSLYVYCATCGASVPPDYSQLYYEDVL